MYVFFSFRIKLNKKSLPKSRSKLGEQFIIVVITCYLVGKPVAAVVEHVRDGTTLRLLLLPDIIQVRDVTPPLQLAAIIRGVRLYLTINFFLLK